jgi:tRNA (guanine26-N2/guanine27-N2)-dimethyltransferase
MSPKFPVDTIIEGKASIMVPRLDPDSKAHIQQQISQAPVFYNKVQKTNRDTAVIALRVLQKDRGRGVDVCEPMTGSGVRGIRFLLETGEIRSLVLGDLSPSALDLASGNAKLNGVADRVKLRELDANLLMSLHSFPKGRFDYIDVDPYGTPVFFIDTAVRATKNHGVIALTATDMAPLCGVNPRACIRKYGGRPLKGEFCHETALRLMTAAMVRQSAINEYAATPVFTYYADHYIRGYYRLDKGARVTEKQLNQIGFIKYCPSCLNRFPSMENAPERCECGEEMNIGGPLWLGELSDEAYLDAMIAELDELDYLQESRAAKFMRLVKGEQGYPVGFFDIDKVCKKVKIKSAASEEVFAAVKAKGFRITHTHFGPRSIKTDAPVSELTDIFKEIG